MITGGAMAIVGSFVPWASMGPFSVSGIQGGDGWFTLVGGLALLLIGISSQNAEPMSRAKTIGGWMAVVVTALVAGYDLINLANLVGDIGDDALFTASVGAGLPLVLLGVVLAGYGLFRLQTAAPPVTDGGITTDGETVTEDM
jgi:hypothetical protein